MSLYVLILAGGSGERFWPLSRRAKPKQLLALFSEETLLAATLRRLDGLVPPERVLILTNADQEAGVRAIATRLPRENIVAEPAKRDTAAAIALGASWIATRDGQATMVVLPADHLIQDIAGFQQTLRVAAGAAERTGDLVTIGLQPTWACPGFGYIELGTEVGAAGGGPRTFEVTSFREKPNADLAETFLRKGTFRWNAGMFVWSIPAILSAFTRHVPELAHFIERLHTAKDWLGSMQENFSALPKISIDYAIMEKARRVLVVEAAFDWDDVGNWPAVAKYLRQAGDGNATNVALEAIDSQDNIVYSDQPGTIALLGVKDLIVVRTGDALLVCHRHDSEKIKQLVAKVPPELQ
ncbi:MAG TPA: sugar phosphate nucleotidyltransferase [Chthoniobacteraceae bacterium]|jgi:mannose-1-phosphate guanylyltransferase|nr:sugar phosphate nucleotidyltransferase [Chthoniobacteraceae bacterium]